MPLAWAFYDFGDTIYSAAVISTAIGLWLTDASRLGNDRGHLVFSIAIAVSVGINALVSPILGALSDRLFESSIGPMPALVGAALLFIVAVSDGWRGHEAERATHDDGGALPLLEEPSAAS